MEGAAIESNLNAIKEMVLDEEKLVTYVSLSKDLCIHVNDSKRLLAKFVDNLREKQPDIGLHVSYIISGLAEGNKARTTVCTSEDMDVIKKDFNLVFFEHIYSVIKGTQAADKVALMSVSRLEDFPLCTGLIKSNVCLKRTIDEICSLKTISQVTVKDEQKTDQKKAIVEKQEVSKVVTVHEKISEPKMKTEKVLPAKDTSSAKASKNNGAKPQRGIAGFFTKSNSAPSKSITKITEQNPELKKELKKESPKIKVEKMETSSVTEVKKETITTVKQKPEAKAATTNGSSNKNKKLKEIKKNAKVDNKRKRLLLVSDSESEEDKDPFIDEAEDVNMSEDEIPPTPTINTVKITSGIVNPKKRRKVVDKTYTDEDGYILTKKEEVYESCSDNESSEVKENIQVSPAKKAKVEPSPVKAKKETSPPEKKNAKSSKKKISPPQKGKQATMMNFFKKV